MNENEARIIKRGCDTVPKEPRALLSVYKAGKSVFKCLKFLMCFLLDKFFSFKKTDNPSHKELELIEFFEAIFNAKLARKCLGLLSTPFPSMLDDEAVPRQTTLRKRWERQGIGCLVPIFLARIVSMLSSGWT